MPFRCVIASVLFASAALFYVLPSAHANDQPTPEQVFEKRIMPIFKSPNPSSCTQCHLSGVDLKNYILPSSEKTFLSLRDQGLSISKAGGLENSASHQDERGRQEGAQPHPREDAQGRV